MAFTCSMLEVRYLDYCKTKMIPPHKEILGALHKIIQVRTKKLRKETCSLDIHLDRLKDADFYPLHRLLMDVEASNIDAVNISNTSSCSLKGEYALLLMRAAGRKLGTVDLLDWPFGKSFLRDLSHRGLTCETLNLKYSHFRKLKVTGPCPTSTFWKEVSMSSTQPSASPSTSALSDMGWLSTNENMDTEGLINNLFSLAGATSSHDIPSTRYESSDDSEMDFSSHPQESGLENLLNNEPTMFNRSTDIYNEVVENALGPEDEASSSDDFSLDLLPSTNFWARFVPVNPSPICFEKHYREYMIDRLPQLRVLDNLLIRNRDREKAKLVFCQYFEYLPYKRNCVENVVNILQKREVSASRTILQPPNMKSRRSQNSYSRSFCASKVGSSAWPLLQKLSIWNKYSGVETRNFRPRQFEYHPTNSSLMVFGTLDGDVVIINHESGEVVCYIPSLGEMNSVLGLCWLKKYPSKLIAGSDNGSLKLFDMEHMQPVRTGGYRSAQPVTFDAFDQLTSVHVNSTDELFLASGYSRNVALYDINTGIRLQMFTNMHREHINVVKFANLSHPIFATSSFDQDVKLWDLRQKPVRPCYTVSSSRGNVMVCFSPNDQYLLASAVDNEVNQYLTVDGRPQMNFDIPSTGSSQNYTRSYYLNGGDYIISGSCDEHVVRVCCSQTGRRLRDIALEGKGSRSSMFVQSLRGDPFREFNMSILATYMRPSSKSEIVKINMLASSDSGRESTTQGPSRPSFSEGG
uniref:U2A'/phosphoprotein 32 family A C-terminal domain-containing protein n=2 Tax=Kalanchoe fedtschenkoi TaxID=63787 RepID=A0A7N0TWP9_KALFE